MCVYIYICIPGLCCSYTTRGRNDSKPQNENANQLTMPQRGIRTGGSDHEINNLIITFKSLKYVFSGSPFSDHPLGDGENCESTSTALHWEAPAGRTRASRIKPAPCCSYIDITCIKHTGVCNKYSFCASPCPAVQQQKLLSSPRLGALKADLNPMCIIFRRKQPFSQTPVSPLK